MEALQQLKEPTQEGQKFSDPSYRYIFNTVCSTYVDCSHLHMKKNLRDTVCSSYILGRVLVRRKCLIDHFLISIYDENRLQATSWAGHELELGRNSLMESVLVRLI